MNQAIQIGAIQNNLSGQYKVQIVDSKTKEIVEDYGWHKNVILNSGMDLLWLNAYAEVVVYACAGTGSRPNKITSSNSTITQSGTLVTLWPGAGEIQDFTSSYTASSGQVYYSSSLQVGDVIVYANASQSNVLAVAGLSASVNTSYTIESGSNQEFTIWKTSQTSLQKEIKRTNTYLAGAGSCGSTDYTGSAGVVNVRVYRRTYDFSTETIERPYTEIGVSPSATANTLLFSRVLLPATVTISASFQLRLVYDLVVEFGPTTLTPITASISGWTNTQGSASLQNSIQASSINTNGSTTTLFDAVMEAGPDSSASTARRSPLDTLSANTHRGVFLSSSTASLVPCFSVGASRNTATVYAASVGGHTSPPYVIGSYTYIKENHLGVTQANTTTASGIWSVGFGKQGSDFAAGAGTSQAFILLFHNSQSKANTQVVSMSFAYSWGRTLAGT